jgi:hypothetical protein
MKGNPESKIRRGGEGERMEREDRKEGWGEGE